MIDLLSCKPRIRDDVILRKQDEGYLLYNPATDHLHSVSDEGVRFLSLLDGKLSIEDAIRIFVHALDCDEKEMERVKWLTLLFVKDLMERQLLEIQAVE